MAIEGQALLKIQAGRVLVDARYWVGPSGTIFYDEVTGQLRIGDGVTPGGRILSFDVTKIDTNIVPVTGDTYTIGTDVKPFKTLYLSSSTFVVGGQAITVYPDGNISVAGKMVGTGYTGSASFVPGYTGSRAYTGSAGYTGSQSYTGSSGYTGSIGYTGSEGYTGSIGYTGSSGYAGSVGYTGSEGYAGSVGYTGSIGYTGSQSYTGSSGYTGSIGYTGSEGYAGSIGYVGSKSRYDNRRTNR